MSDPINWTCKPCTILNIFGRCKPDIGGQYKSSDECNEACPKCTSSQWMWIIIVIVGVLLLALIFRLSIYAYIKYDEYKIKKEKEKASETQQH